jgi:hypothetical protein
MLKISDYVLPHIFQKFWLASLSHIPHKLKLADFTKNHTFEILFLIFIYLVKPPESMQPITGKSRRMHKF